MLTEYQSGEELKVLAGKVREYRFKNIDTTNYRNYPGKIELKVNHDGFELLFSISYNYFYTETDKDTDTRDHQWCWNDVTIKECPKNLIVTFNITNTARSRSIRLSSDSPKSNINSYISRTSSRDSFYFDIVLEVYEIENERAQSLADDYGELFKNGQSSDVVFVVDKEEIRAHKLILSTRSEVFARMLESDMLEKQNGRVDISDIDADTFKFLLRFLYCGQLDTYEAEELLKLIMAADKYSVKSLISTCGHRLLKKLSVENAVDVLLTADAVKLDFLKKSCMNFIIKHKEEIVGTEDFEKFIKSRSDLISELILSLKL